MTIWEPYIAEITGKLTSFRTQNGYLFNLGSNGFHVEKGQGFMVEFNQEDSKIRMVPVVMPDIWIGMAR